MPVIYEPAGRAKEYAPLAANLYRGCGHGCLYCYAPAVLRADRNEFHAAPKCRTNILAELKKDAAAMGQKNPGASVLLSFTTDPYQPLDVEAGLTREAIRILHEHGLTVEILTKGGSRALRDFDLLTAADRFATTLTCIDPMLSEHWEPGAALPIDRIDTIRKAKEAGITTWVSLEPVLNPGQTLELIHRTHEYVDLYKVGTLNHHPQAREIDWRKFGNDAVDLLTRLGNAYYVKKDLREKMAG